MPRPSDWCARQGAPTIRGAGAQYIAPLSCLAILIENYCVGILTITDTTISYQGTRSPHSFEIPLEAIEEAKKNDFYGAELSAFHIKLKTKSNYNFVAGNEDGEPISPDPLLFAIQKALLNAKQR